MEGGELVTLRPSVGIEGQLCFFVVVCEVEAEDEEGGEGLGGIPEGAVESPNTARLAFSLLRAGFLPRLMPKSFSEAKLRCFFLSV
jgi:hypothetical protein